MNVKALSDYDGFDFESAKQSLEDAIAEAKRSGCLSHVVGGKAYLYLGVVHVGGFKDFEAGKKAWFQVFRAFPDMTIPRRLATPRLLRAFVSIKQQFKDEGGTPARPGPRVGVTPTVRPVPKGPPKGLEHETVSEATATKSLTISCRVADELAATKISLFYRPSYMASYRQVDMAKKGQWTWSTTIEGPKVRGVNIRYFMVVLGAGGKAVAASGNAASPHMITLKRPKIAAGGIEENPLTGRRIKKTSRHAPRVSYGEVELPGVKRRRGTTYREDRPEPVKKKFTTRHRPYFAVYAGTGAGIGLLNGTAEVARDQGLDPQPKQLPDDVSGGALYGHIDLAFLLNRNTALGGLVRIGKTFISKTVEDQDEGNDMDWQVFFRYKYLSGQHDFGRKAPAWLAWRWHAGLGVGYGVIRHHIKARESLVGDKRGDFTDTDRAKGVLPNAFGGVMLCMFDARLNVFLEANYLAAFSSQPRDNLYFHLDFTLGLGTEF